MPVVIAVITVIACVTAVVVWKCDSPGLCWKRTKRGRRQHSSQTDRNRVISTLTHRADSTSSASKITSFDFVTSHPPDLTQTNSGLPCGARDHVHSMHCSHGSIHSAENGHRQRLSNSRQKRHSYRVVNNYKARENPKLSCLIIGSHGDLPLPGAVAKRKVGGFLYGIGEDLDIIQSLVGQDENKELSAVSRKILDNEKELAVYKKEIKKAMTSVKIDHKHREAGRKCK